jgi:hypothetical protein
MNFGMKEEKTHQTISVSDTHKLGEGKTGNSLCKVQTAQRMKISSCWKREMPLTIPT